MKLGEVLNRDQRSERFSGKRKRTEMESPESIAGPVAATQRQAVKSQDFMEQPRRSVIWARSELFRVEPDLSDEENLLHIALPPRVETNLMKRAASEEDFSMFGLTKGEEKELIWKHMYRHKKFNKQITILPSSEPNANRPSVIVRHRSKVVERDLDLDFNDISSTEPSPLEADIDIEEMLNVSDFNLQKPTFDMYNLYFVDEVPYDECIGGFRNSFFAIWRTLPLGESAMGDYIKFCQDKTATLPNYWMGMALKQTRCD